MNSDIEDDIMDSVIQCTTLPSHLSFSQQKLVSFVKGHHGPSDAMHNSSQPFKFLLTETYGNPASANIKQALARLCGGGGIPFQLKSDSLPHAHTQAKKTYYKHQDSRIKKAQELNTKTSANSDIQDIPKSYQDYQDNDCQGRLLASFQDDA
ncbi:hypothetical protein Tco_0883554 [Tanacetum coccineum]